MKKEYIIAVLIVSILLIILLILIILIKPGEEDKILENCNTLQYNGDDKIDIVFFSNKNNVEEYSNFILNMSPFNENKDQFNIFYIDNYIPDCEIYQNIALLCYSKEIIKKSASCPNDYIVVIKDKESKIRSSSYMNVMSLNSNHQLTVFPHEFGHSFAILAEEYTPAELLDKSKNCVSECNQFDEKKDGCFKGCSKEDYFRSIDSGIMKTLKSNTYGKIDEEIINERIKKARPSITGFAASPISTECEKNEYYLIEAELKNNNISLITKSLETGCFGGNGIGSFNLTLIKKDGSTAYKDEFNPENMFTDSQQDEIQINGEILKYTKFILKIPVIENAKTIEISNQQIKTIINLDDIDSRPCR